jgi:signal peptidase I
VVVGLAIWGLIEFIGREVPTYGPSMLPTIGARDSVDIDTGAYEDGEPQLGDIVALQAPAGVRTEVCAVQAPPTSPCPRADPGYESIRLIKRVVAGPGDRVAFDAAGHLIRNGERVNESYIKECPGTCALPRAVTVPPGHYFVAGDNRGRSTDSRFWGAVPSEAIDGRVEVTQG